MRILKYVTISIFLFIGIGFFAFFYFQTLFSPIRDDLHLKYITTLHSVSPPSVSEQSVLFTKINPKYYQADISSTGLLENQQKYIVDKYFIDKEGRSLSGPTAAVLWIAPYLLKIGNKVAAGEVIKFTEWRGYSTAVVQDQALNNCYGFYDRKTGIQVGYMNCFSANKLLTVIKESNI